MPLVPSYLLLSCQPYNLLGFAIFQGFIKKFKIDLHFLWSCMNVCKCGDHAMGRHTTGPKYPILSNTLLFIYFPWFKDHAGSSLRVFGVVLLPQQPSFPWPWASCLSMFYRVSHFSPGFLQQCNEMYVRKMHDSKLWMWVWIVGYMSVWTFWWTGQSLL